MKAIGYFASRRGGRHRRGRYSRSRGGGQAHHRGTGASGSRGRKRDHDDTVSAGVALSAFGLRNVVVDELMNTLRASIRTVRKLFIELTGRIATIKLPLRDSDSESTAALHAVFIGEGMRTA